MQKPRSYGYLGHQFLHSRHAGRRRWRKGREGRTEKKTCECDLTRRRPEVLKPTKMELQGVQGGVLGANKIKKIQVPRHQNRRLEAPRGVLGRSWSILEVSWSVLMASSVVLGASWGILDRPGSDLGAFWVRLGCVFGCLGGPLCPSCGRLVNVLERLACILL